MEFILLWLGLNAVAPVLVFVFVILMVGGKPSKIELVIGITYSLYAFVITILPSIGIAALIKYLV